MLDDVHKLTGNGDDGNDQYWKESYERQGDWLIQTVKPNDMHRIRLNGEQRQKERY